MHKYINLVDEQAIFMIRLDVIPQGHHYYLAI